MNDNRSFASQMENAGLLPAKRQNPPAPPERHRENPTGNAIALRIVIGLVGLVLLFIAMGGTIAISVGG